MIPTAKSIPELLREAQSEASPIDHQPIRVLICGVPKGVDNLVGYLHILGFAEVGEWSPPVPSPIEGEVIRILTRYYTT
ncbi:MAG TPA: hypothetical protein IGS17_14295 [Oscillatoriales cyanobacterium M59_W2019_021]|nr:MAG: hypothetical protein D6728_15415 [Cyanobacteria bacterium J055]HIK30657.1 hypothetical protein [Oscillatoriales cyanobacterium M4454_W2019_049]HIK52073.1 hypothetical protein [Oscillatoriales cyanobacterium M59_W2019_021]